jgi:formamidopyrimidine-DNA glycosylase
MPELPEVETIVRLLRPDLVGRTVLAANVRWPRTIAFPSVRTFKRQITGQVIQGVTRRAKFLHLQLSTAELLIHLRMSGDLELKQPGARPSKHDRLILLLAPAGRSASSQAPSTPASAARDSIINLVFNDTRKFGRVWLTKDARDVTGRLGPEPLERRFTVRRLYLALHARHRQLKPLLLDQTFIAGLGNIYTDEALHLAKLHPLARADSLTELQAGSLHAAIRRTLREGIRRNGASIDWVYRGGEFQNHFRVYDRAGRPCPVCGTKIKRLTVGQRGTHICPHCQRV